MIDAFDVAYSRATSRIVFASIPQIGAIVSGEYLQSLPPSVLSVLGAEPGSGVVPLRSASVWDNDLPTDYAVSGSRLLTLTIER